MELETPMYNLFECLAAKNQRDKLPPIPPAIVMFHYCKET